MRPTHARAAARLDQLVDTANARAEAACAEARTLQALSTLEQNFRSGEAWLHMFEHEQDDLIQIITWRREEIERAAEGESAE